MQTQSKKTINRKVIYILITISLLIATSVLTYCLTDISNNDIESRLNNEIKQLKSENDNLNKTLEDETDSDTIKQSSDTKTPSETDLSNIKTAISIGNTEPLQGYMAQTVSVILAASEGIGDRAPVQATLDITDFIKNSGSWDFELSASVLNSYGNSFYGQYFPNNATVGKSSTGKIISISFDKNAKINQVFFATAEDVLN